jgi:hypothetical protein
MANATPPIMVVASIRCRMDRFFKIILLKRSGDAKMPPKLYVPMHVDRRRA